MLLRVDTALETIVKFPSLSVSELTLFRSCLAWSSKECQRRGLPDAPDNQRTVLGSVLNHVRFPTMSLREFAQDVSRTGVLTADDRCAVFEYLVCRNDSLADNSDDDAGRNPGAAAAGDSQALVSKSPFPDSATPAPIAASPAQVQCVREELHLQRRLQHDETAQ